MIKYLNKNLLKTIIIQLFFVIYISPAQDGYKWSEPENINIINSKANDFAPSWNKFEKRIYFNSDRNQYSNFYLTHFDNSANFKTPILARGTINAQRNNQSYIAFLDENTAIYSSYRMEARRPYLNLFVCRKKKNEWGESSPITELQGKYYTAQPTISPDGKTMIFATTIESEKKDTDLWATYLQDDNTWSQPVFISELNTSGNEITPFLLSEDTLFFASNGQGGPGGYDIFYSVKGKGFWQKPYPLSGLNTEYDESDFTLLPNGLAIFSSARPGGKGGLDLWSSYLQIESQTNQDYLADFELSIALQATNIKTHRDLVYDSYFIPYIISINAEVIPKFIMNNAMTSACGSSKLIDSIYSNIFSLMATEFKRSSNRIVITTYGVNNDTTKMIEQIKDYFINNYGINSQRFIVQNIKNTAFGSVYISFEMDSKDHTSFYKLGKDSISLIPPVIELNIDARPRKLMRSWELITTANNENHILSKTGTEVPARIISDFRQHECNLAYSDSILFNITGVDSIGRKVKERIKLPISHTISEKANISTISQKEYYSYFLLLFDPEFLSKYGFYDEFFEKVKELYTKGKSIILNDYTALSNTNINIRDIQNISNADELIAQLKKRCNVSDQDIELKYLQNKKWIAPFSLSFNPFVFEVMIEK